jgi:hypothetical protein
VKKAEGLAAIAPPNPELQPHTGAQQFPPTNDFDEPTALARAPEMIPHVRTIIDAAAKQKLVAAGLIERSHRVNAVATKAGLFGFHSSSDSQLTTTIHARRLCPDGPGSPPREYPASTVAPRRHRHRERPLENPQRIEPGNHTVVLEPTAATHPPDRQRIFGAQHGEGRTFEQTGRRDATGEKLFSNCHPAHRSVRSPPARLTGLPSLSPPRRHLIDKGAWQPRLRSHWPPRPESSRLLHGRPGGGGGAQARRRSRGNQPDHDGAPLSTT